MMQLRSSRIQLLEVTWEGMVNRVGESWTSFQTVCFTGSRACSASHVTDVQCNVLQCHTQRCVRLLMYS